MPVPYVHATTAADAQRWLADLGSPTFVAIDTETGGWDPLLDRLRLVQVSAGPERPVLVVDAERLDPAVLGGLLADEGVLKVFHHGAFDLRFLAQAGLVARRVADTMLAQQLLDGGARTAQGSGLAQLASFRLGRELDKSIRETFAAATPLNDAHLQYAADDAAATLGGLRPAVARARRAPARRGRAPGVRRAASAGGAAAARRGVRRGALGGAWCACSRHGCPRSRTPCRPRS